MLLSFIYYLLTLKDLVVFLFFLFHFFYAINSCREKVKI